MFWLYVCDIGYVEWWGRGRNQTYVKCDTFLGKMGEEPLRVEIMKESWGSSVGILANRDHLYTGLQQ
jgi:hypothetical protein